MKIILINRRYGGSRSVELGRWSRALLSLCCLGLPLGIAAVGYVAGQHSDVRTLRGAALDSLQDDLEQQSVELQDLRSQAQRKLQALTLNLAELQARMTRIDALGEHLTAIADLEGGEFNFSEPPALGGPLAGEFNVDFTTLDLGAELARLEAHLSDREEQLDILQSLWVNRKLGEQSWLSGRPVRKGWVSSRYGVRTDPFTGKPAVHKGIDFAGREGSEIIAAPSPRRCRIPLE